MYQLHQFVVRLGSRVDLRLLIASLVTLNIVWLIILRTIGGHFEQVAGYPLLDLQNSISPDAVMTPTRAITQIATYTSDAKTLYWSFFILDNIMPQLTFGLFALLWVVLLRGTPHRLARRLLGSYLLLLPLGVGLFDWAENLAYVAAIHVYPAGDLLPWIYAGLITKWLKAACLMVTFWGTLPIAIYATTLRLRQRRVRAAGGAVS
ncbi:MAG TPA: hypothetical protein VEZ12_20140 [Herpetosiphonaceae bacterium]|nr:hypothetical protein [Herpetosiphonaceae bacterium]